MERRHQGSCALKKYVKWDLLAAGAFHREIRNVVLAEIFSPVSVYFNYTNALSNFATAHFVYMGYSGASG